MQHPARRCRDGPSRRQMGRPATIFMNDESYSLLPEGVQRGEKCLYVTLSETRQELDGDGAITMIQPSDLERILAQSSLCYRRNRPAGHRRP